MGKTTVDLAKHLEAKPASPTRDELIKRARRGDFHDFLSLYELPKTEAVHALDAAGFSDLAERVKQGDYDDEHVGDGSN